MYSAKRFFLLLTLLLMLLGLAACEQQQPEPEAPHTHAFGVWETVLEGTCVKEGKQTRSCACGETEERPHLSDHSYAASNICTICGDFKNCTNGVINFRSNGNGTCYITGHTRAMDENLVLPTTSPDGDRVVAIGKNAFSENIYIKNVTIPDTVTHIGSFAFAGCTRIKTITIGKGVTTIGDYAFDGCTAVTNIHLYATALEDFDSNNYVFSRVGKDGNGITLNIHANVTRIPAYFFYPHTSLNYDTYFSPYVTNVRFAANSACTSIGDYAFHTCWYLKSLNLPASVTEIAARAFVGCAALHELTVDAVHSNGNGNSILTAPFWTNTGITRITHVTVTCGTSICDGAFAYCSPLASITLPDTITRIGSRAFYNCNGLTAVPLPDGVQTIGAHAYEACSSLAYVVIPHSVTQIETAAFDFCAELTAVYYCGTEAEWQSVSIEANAFDAQATVYYYAESQPVEGGNYWHYVDGMPTKW